MPTDDRHPDHDDPRADGPDEPAERDPLLPFSIWTKVIPREHTALSVPAVEWLLSRAGGMWGRYGGIRLPMTLAFLDDVDPAEPVGVIRARLERTRLGKRGQGDVVVALCSFVPKEGGSSRLINELVCRPEDYVRVAHGSVMFSEWTHEELRRLKERERRREEIAAPPEALPEGTVGVVQPDGSVELVMVPGAEE